MISQGKPNISYVRVIIEHLNSYVGQLNILLQLTYVAWINLLRLSRFLALQHVKKSNVRTRMIQNSSSQKSRLIPGTNMFHCVLCTIFHKRMPPEAVDLVSRLLQYYPNLRCTALEACVHPFLDELCDPNTRLPSGRLLPLFNFKPQELKGTTLELLAKLILEHTCKQCPFLGFSTLSKYQQVV